jgi:hypothetical protein
MATNFTNQTKSQALRGQGVLVTLNGSDAANLYLVREGQLATVSSNNKTGTIGRVDVYGNTFIVDPIQPDRSFDSAPAIYGYLNSAETIIVNT